MKCYNGVEVMCCVSQKPPFEITNAILDRIAEIGELVGQANAAASLTTNSMLRRTMKKAPVGGMPLGWWHSPEGCFSTLEART